MESFMKRVAKVQAELKAPKGQFNSFGKYKYRSCEDILEAVKPLNNANGLVLTVCDSIVECAGRIYVEATATLYDTDSDQTLSNRAYAREPDEKKGMDDSQVTGTASSYARKYALNGLYCIDDTKDADTDEHKNESVARTEKAEYRIPPKDDVPVLCEGCGKRFSDYFDGNNLIKADALAKRSAKKFGKALCPNCAKKC